MHGVMFLIALAAAGLTGFANQRGGICMVAAIEDIATRRRFGRMIALLEASLWVAGGLILISAIGVRPKLPPGYTIGLATIVGGVVFGLGAVVNRACLFGTVAHLGAGQWAYAATPLGLFVGSLAVARLRLGHEIDEQPFVLGASALATTIAAGFIIGRCCTHGAMIRRKRMAVLSYVWSPPVATTIIGIAFLVSFLAAGNWQYSQFVRDLAHGNASEWPRRSLLAAALLVGALVGGRQDRSTKSTVDLAHVARCTIGGGLMGVGAGLVPGGNTTLLLLGMPMLWPYAWVAFAIMCGTIYAAILIQLAMPARLWR